MAAPMVGGFSPVWPRPWPRAPCRALERWRAQAYIGRDEQRRRRAAPERASGPLLDARRLARLHRRDDAGYLGQPHLPDKGVQRRSEYRRNRPRDALCRLDPVDDAAPFGG